MGDYIDREEWEAAQRDQVIKLEAEIERLKSESKEMRDRLSGALGQKNASSHRIWSRDGESIVATRWVEDWTALINGDGCGCAITSCEHDAVRRLISRSNAKVVVLLEQVKIGLGVLLELDSWRGPASTPEQKVAVARLRQIIDDHRAAIAKSAKAECQDPEQCGGSTPDGHPLSLCLNCEDKSR